MTVRRPVRFLVSLALIASALTAAVAGPAAADPPSGPDYVPKGYQFDWSDEFPGGTLNANDWYKREGSKAICKNDPANVTVGSGVMHIALKRETNGDTDYTCGGIISKKTFGYGYYETRAKLWSELGWHSAFWQMGLADYVPDAPQYKGPYNRFNEIDGFEIDSHAPSTIQQHTHWTVPQHIGNPGGVYAGPNSADGYHTYGYEWLPSEIRFYVDGVLNRTLAYPGPHALQNVWLTTLGFTEGIVDSTLPGETTWDYFRYYKPVSSSDDIATGEVLVDNGDPGYAETGTWAAAGDAYGYQDKITRRAAPTGSTATWTPTLPATQSYEVYAWNPDFIRTGSTAARYAVTHDGGATNVLVDQTKAGQQWIDLGNYVMTPAAGRKVQLVNNAGATGTLRADAVKFVPTVVVDNGGAGYSEVGTWASTTTVKGWRDTDTRYASAPTSTARWAPALPTAGRYDVYAWIPAGAAANASYKITSAGGATADVDPAESVVVDRWVRLGNYNFAAGSAGSVELSRPSGIESFLRADAVKFVPSPAADAVAPTTPSGVTKTVQTFPSTGDAVLNLQWTPVTGTDVVGHHVYLDGRRQTANPVRRGSFELHELLAGQTYQLSVTSIDRSGNESPASTAVAVQVPVDSQAPTTPTGLVGEAANGQAVLYWNQNPELDLLGYNVYKDGVLVNKPDEPFGNIGNPGLVAQGIPVPGLANNVAHSLQVKAVDLSGNESAAATVSVTPLDMAIVGVNNDAGYTETGAWAASSIPGWQTTPTRASNGTGKSATWRPTLATAGQYDVYAWIPNHSNSTIAARYTITHATGTATIDKNQQTGGMQWILLGRYQFAAGTTGHVTITNPSGAGYLRTSYTKFVPVTP